METEQEKFRILTCYYRPKPGGLCKRLFRAINALLERGHIVHYLAVVPFPIDHQNLHFHRFPWPKNHTSGYLFWAFFHIFSPVQLLYFGFTYRINRLFAFGNNYALFLQPIRILKRIPLTLFIRADTIENHRLKKRSILLLTIETILEGLALKAVRLYGVSEILTRNLEGRHNFFKPLISGTFRNDLKNPANRKKEKRSISLPLRLGCVGILEPRKNQLFLLKVMKKLNRDQAQLYLYGIGPDEPLLKEMVIMEGLSDRVHFMGWVDADQLWPTIDLLLVPSLHEGAPNAMLEAISYGVPVLASDIEEHREIMMPSMLFSIHSHDELLETVLNIIVNYDTFCEKIFSDMATVANKLQFDWDEKISILITA